MTTRRPRPAAPPRPAHAGGMAGARPGAPRDARARRSPAVADTSVEAVKYHLANISGKLGVAGSDAPALAGHPGHQPPSQHRRTRPTDAPPPSDHRPRLDRPGLALDPRCGARGALLRRDARASASVHLRRPRLLRRRRHAPLPASQGRGGLAPRLGPLLRRRRHPRGPGVAGRARRPFHRCAARDPHRRRPAPRSG